MRPMLLTVALVGLLAQTASAQCASCSQGMRMLPMRTFQTQIIGVPATTLKAVPVIQAAPVQASTVPFDPGPGNVLIREDRLVRVFRRGPVRRLFRGRWKTEQRSFYYAASAESLGLTQQKE